MIKNKSFLISHKNDYKKGYFFSYIFFFIYFFYNSISLIINNLAFFVKLLLINYLTILHFCKLLIFSIIVFSIDFFYL